MFRLHYAQTMDTFPSPDLNLIYPRLALDLVAILILLFGLFMRNHKRAGLVSVYLACNIGLFAVLTILAFSPLSSSVGFALFGVLSIIRLRSYEFEHVEIAYFFMSLSLALITAIDLGDLKLPLLLSGVVLLAIGLVDTKYIRNQSKLISLTLNEIIIDSDALKSHLAQLLNASILDLNVKSINQQTQSMKVDVTYK